MEKQPIVLGKMATSVVIQIEDYKDYVLDVIKDSSPEFLLKFNVFIAEERNEIDTFERMRQRGVEMESAFMENSKILPHYQDGIKNNFRFGMLCIQNKINDYLKIHCRDFNIDVFDIKLPE